MRVLKSIAHRLGFAATPSMFQGDYPSWEAAQQRCEGYQAEAILEKVRAAVLKVKRGEAVYERDSVLFDAVEYSWPLLAGLLRIACGNGNRLSVVDFGGSLGSSYFQNREFLRCLDSLRWSIVEQPHFVACGREEFADAELAFHYTIAEALAHQEPHVLLLSSVIQYLPDPYAFAREFVERGFDYIVIDRTPFLLDEAGEYAGEERLTVQTVPESIYRASYPAWFFDKNRFLDAFSPEYRLVCGWEGADRVSSPRCSFEGLMLQRVT